MLTTMDAVQYSDVHSQEDGAVDLTMGALLEQNRESSFRENAEVRAGMFEYLPGFVDGSQESFSENSVIDMLMYPQKYRLSPTSRAESAAKLRQSGQTAKFDDLEMCHDSLMRGENNTVKMCAAIVLEATPDYSMKMASETSATILIPSKCQNEYSSQKIDSLASEAGVFEHANQQESFSQESEQLKLPAVLKRLHSPNDNVDQTADCDTYVAKPVSETRLQHEENTNKHFKGDQCVELLSDDIASKQQSEEHGIFERFSTLGAVSKTDLLQNEKNTNMYLEGEQCISMGSVVISSKQHTEDHENDKEYIVLGAVRKPDLVVIQASLSDREEDSENVDPTLHVSMEGDVKTALHKESPEKQLERELQCFSVNMGDNALRQHNEECINTGQLSILKALNKPDSGISEENLTDGERPYADINQALAMVSDRGAEMPQNAHIPGSEFNIGDLVWAKVRSHPWWPAQVFDPAHASEAAKKLEQSGRVLIAFFGDCTFAWLQKSQLIAFQPNFKMMAKQTDNKNFCKGVVEAQEEFCKLSELALICQHYKGPLHSSRTPLSGQAGNGIVNAKHCKPNLENVERVKSAKTLEFIKSIACNPFGSCEEPSLEAAELRGHAYGFRACMVALSTTHSLQNMQAAETLSVRHNQQKRKFSDVNLYIEPGVEAIEVKKKVKTSDVTEMERQEDGAETLLALACYHPKLLKRLEMQRSRKDLQCQPAKKMDCKQTLSQLHDLKPISGSKASSKVNIRATTNVRCKRRKKSEAQDPFIFIPPELEENLPEDGIKVLKRRKNSLIAEVPKLTRSKQLEAKKQFNLLSLEGLDGSKSSEVQKQMEAKMSIADMKSSPDDTLGEKSNKLLRVGYSIRKVAIELAGTPPPHKCVDGSSKNTTKVKSKKKVIGGSSKTMSSLKHDKALFQGSVSDECHFSTAQLHQTLKLLATNPLNKANVIRSSNAIAVFLRFRAEVVKIKDVAKLIFNEVRKDEEVSSEDAQIGVKTVLKDDQLSKALGWNRCGEYVSQAVQKGKQIMFEEEADTAKDALEHDLEKSSNSSASLNKSLRHSSKAARKGKQILLEEAGGAEDQISKALKTWNELPNEHSENAFQAAWEGKSKTTQGTAAKSSRKYSTSISGKRPYSPAPEVREQIEPRLFENSEDPFPQGFVPAASITGSFSRKNCKKLSGPLQLGISMRFPQNFTLPSEPQLKAMFVQFGPVQPSGVTVFKDLALAQVVFTNGEDAKAAYKHVKKTAMFGHASVTYKLCHFSFSDNQKETRKFLRGDSSRAHEKVPNHKDEHAIRCLKLATSLKERVHGHMRAVSELSWKSTKNGQASRTASMQHSRNGNIATKRRRSDQLGDGLQERMMTLLRRVNVIVGTPDDTPNTK